MKIYILEDEVNILQYIISLVDQYESLELVGYATNLTKARQEIPTLKPDLILADIHLQGGNSLTFFKELETNSQVIFITAYDHYAIEALNLGALAYLLKPINPQEFNTAIEKCKQKINIKDNSQHQAALALSYLTDLQKPKKIALRSADFIDIVNIEDIVYCQSDKGYTTFILKDNSKILVSKIIKEYESILPVSQFFRCHQSYLINTAFLKKYHKEGLVEMSNGDTLPVSDRKRNVLLSLIDKIFN